MGRFFVVGDIHGCPQELETLLTSLQLHSEDRLVCLGDYVDRGPDVRAVVELLVGLQADGVCELTFLKGNHEDMFLDFLGYPGHYGEAFLMNGGVQTVMSYGGDPYTLKNGEEVAELLPEAHRQFFLNLQLVQLVDSVLCVHAGIDPVLPLEQQNAEDLLWIRQAFIDHPHMLPYLIVYGHTPQREVRFQLPYKIGIDTGLVYGGKLTCLEWTEKKLFQITNGSRQVKMTDIAPLWENGQRREGRKERTDRDVSSK